MLTILLNVSMIVDLKRVVFVMLRMKRMKTKMVLLWKTRPTPNWRIERFVIRDSRLASSRGFQVVSCARCAIRSDWLALGARVSLPKLGLRNL